MQTIKGWLGLSVVGTVITLYFTLFHFQPDLRYEEQAYYRSGDEAVMSLKLHNYGERDAKDVTITANLPARLVKEPITDDDAYPLSIKDGGKGKDHVAGVIQRIVPGQSVFCYFTMENPRGQVPTDHKSIVKAITLENGAARTGRPWFWKTMMLIAFWSVTGYSLAHFHEVQKSTLRNRIIELLQEREEILEKAVEMFKTITDEAKQGYEALAKHVLQGLEPLSKARNEFVDRTLAKINDIDRKTNDILATKDKEITELREALDKLQPSLKRSKKSRKPIP